MRRLAAVDAQMLWMSAAIPNDQFLLYAFEAGPIGVDRAIGEIRDRARACGELGLRIADTGFWSYPAWVPGQIDADRFVVHEPRDRSWQTCLAAVAGLADDQLDPRVMCWRLHVFPAVADVPGAPDATVAVVQISHALGDGNRSSALAGYLFGRRAPVPAVTAPPHPAAGFPLRAFAAARAHRRLVRDTATGLVPPQADSVPVLQTNAPPAGARHVRTVVCGRAGLPGPTVTVGVLAAVSAALSGHLRDLGDDPSLLAAEVPMAKAGPRLAHNHFGNVGVGLHPELEIEHRTRRIAADLHQRRRRAAHPAMLAESAAFASVPAPVLRWGVRHFDPEARSPTVIGNTVVSSVDRGAGDLRFGDGRVVLTTGFPGLSPMMGLTHGVHGIGGTVTVSVHAAESAVGDPDAYARRLAHELRVRD